MAEANPTPYQRVREAAALLCDPDSDDEAADVLYGKAAASLLGIRRRLDALKAKTAHAKATRDEVRAHLLALRRDLVGRHVARMLYLHRRGGRREGAATVRWSFEPETQNIRQMSVEYAKYTGTLRAILLSAGLSGLPEPDPKGREDAKRLVRKADEIWARVGEDIIFSRVRARLDELLDIGRASIADAERDAMSPFVARRSAEPPAVASRWTAAATELARISARVAREVERELFHGEPPPCVTFETLSEAVGDALGKLVHIDAHGDLDAAVFPHGLPAQLGTAELLDRAARHLALTAAQLEALPPAERELCARGVDELARWLLAVVITVAQASRAHLMVVDLSYLGGLPTIAEAVARTSGFE